MTQSKHHVCTLNPVLHIMHNETRKIEMDMRADLFIMYYVDWTEIFYFGILRFIGHFFNFIIFYEGTQFSFWPGLLNFSPRVWLDLTIRQKVKSCFPHIIFHCLHNMCRPNDAKHTMTDLIPCRVNFMLNKKMPKIVSWLQWNNWFETLCSSMFIWAVEHSFLSAQWMTLVIIFKVMDASPATCLLCIIFQWPSLKGCLLKGMLFKYFININRNKYSVGEQ